MPNLIINVDSSQDKFYEAQLNYYIKYGDLGYSTRVEDAFMKQKHRMVWERRHGPVGQGMNPDKPEPWSWVNRPFAPDTIYSGT